MTLISLISLLVLSSSAFGRSTYSSYSAPEPARDLLVQQRPVQVLPTSQLQSGYGQQTNTFPSTSSYNVQPLNVVQSDQTVIIPKTINTPVRGYGYTMQQALFDEKPQPVLQLTQADILCRGQRPESVIPLEGGRRFVVCLEESKGVEQQCPKGLFFHTESRRCERRLGALENPCASQPCLNNGQCLVTDASSFQCKCAAGFDGINCELDARICQTQQPCGQAPGSRCQSFRAGAALQYICIHQNELAYGLNGQQIQSSPCRGTDGALPLGISDKGFVMCDGERMFIESCPGGTIWDDLNKACVWPDMQGFIATSKTIEEQYKQQTYRQPAMIVPPTIIPQQTFVAPIPAPQLDVVRTVSSYGQNQIQRPSFDLNVLPSKTASYTPAHIQRPSLDFQRSSFEIQRPSFDTKVFPTETSSYGNQKTQETFLRPQETFQRPQETFQRSQETFQKPQETFQRPQETFQKPQEIFQRPQETFQKPQETFQRPQETFQQSQETFQQPQHIFQQPMQKQQDFRSVQQTSSY